MIQRALISVSDKRELIPLGQALAELGVEIISTGGTAERLREAGVPVTPIELATGVPEMLGGRVKTLHPKIHGGILARRHERADEEDLARHGIAKIELVAINLYPFQQTVAQADVTLEEAVEQIDIGGVALLRAAAKNHRDVTVLSDPDDYAPVIALLRDAGEVGPEQRARLALRAFQRTAAYDRAIAGFLATTLPDGANGHANPLPATVEGAGPLRYGENPHQPASLYRLPGAGGLAHAEPLHGKGMSLTNWLDAEAAWRALHPFETPTVVVVKHASPCGIATHPEPVRAWEHALASDPVSAFGGVIAVNRPVDEPLAAALADHYAEVILAPAFTPESLEILTRKKNRRLLRVPPASSAAAQEIRSLPGGLLVQQMDEMEEEIAMDVVTRRAPTEQEQETLRFAWRALLMVKSNAILLAQPVEGGLATVGIGTGQPSRVDAVHLAVRKAGERAAGAVLASDAFFPFPDGIETAAAAGVRAVIQPGGSIRDPEVIAAADRLHLAMVTTGRRHFRH